VLSAERLRDEAASSSYAGDAGRTNNAFVAELTGAAGPWSWQADLRRDDNSAYGAVNTGRLGGAFAFAPGWRLRALAGSTFRAPSYNELVFPGYGVPTLRPERGRSAELGLGWRGQGAEAAATLWRNRVRDLIGYTSDAARCPADPAYAFGCAANTAQARLRGLTLSGRQVLGAFALRAQFDALKATDAATGVPLPRRAERQGTLALDWQRGAFSAGAALVHLGSRPDGGKTLAAETTLDLQAGWRPAPVWQLQAKLANAGDARTEPARDYQGFGRQAWLMLRREGL
jgi:vitamin B12 transporter